MKIAQLEDVDPDWIKVMVRERPFFNALRWIKDESRPGLYVAFITEDREMAVHISDPHIAFEFKLRFG